MGSKERIATTKNKQNLRQMIQYADDKKKVNPLDLSSDQDLSIALMNLLAIEDIVGNNSEFGAEIQDMRTELMSRIVPPCDVRWPMAVDLLAGATRLMNDGFREMSRKNKQQAYDLFDRSYELYAMFWGLNMGLIAPDDKMRI